MLQPAVRMWIHLYLVSVVAISHVVGDSLRGKHLTITTTTNAPYFDLKEDAETMEGNAKYEGAIVDLMNELSTNLGFSYTIKLTEGGMYGTFRHGEWTGMIGEIIRGEADLGMIDMTITSTRETAVDFTHPFLFSGLSILYSSHGQKIESLEDLASLDSVKVGSYCCGSTNAYFRGSILELNQRINAKMIRDDAMMRSNQAGMERVLEEKGGYAFIMEAPSLEYQIARNCDLTQIGKVFSKRGYGLALPKGSPYLEEMNVMILKLRETGRMEQIMESWLHRRSPACSINDSNLVDFSMIGWILGMV